MRLARLPDERGVLGTAALAIEATLFNIFGTTPRNDLAQSGLAIMGQPAHSPC
jgi:hypothetical protein